MNKILVSLLSEQTMPNVLFIKEIGEFDKYIFISTEQMKKKKKLDMIIKSTGIDQSKIIPEIIVDENNSDDIADKLKDMFEGGEEIVVNLTGGTKMMSIGAYNFFKERGAKIYYIPIGNNYIQIHPYLKNRSFSIKYRANVEEYLSAYGIEIKTKSEKRNNLVFEQDKTLKIFNKFINNKIDSNILELLRKKRKDKKVILDENLKQFLNNLDFSELTELQQKQTEYFTGGWFEEYVYFLVKKHKNIKDTYINLNIQIEKNKTPNELDVVFMHENSLYVIECKTALQDDDRSLLNETLYKLSALSKNFGLKVKGFLFTLDNKLRDKDGNIEEKYQKRAALLDLIIVDRQILINKESLNEIFWNKIK